MEFLTGTGRATARMKRPPSAPPDAFTTSPSPKMTRARAARESAPAHRSVRVSLDGLLISNPRFAGVEPRRPPSPSLAERVPALVQRDLEPSEPLTVSVGHLPVRFTLEQLVFVARKFVDPAEDLRVVHGASLLSTQDLASSTYPLASSDRDGWYADLVDAECPSTLGEFDDWFATER